MKTCARCKEQKPTGEYYACKRNRDGLSSWCKPCTRRIKRESNERVKKTNPQAWADRQRAYVRSYKERHPGRVSESDRRISLRNKFGLTIEEYDALAESQAHVCAICGGTNKNGKRLAVDHCHVSGRIRALLCGPCNAALGVLSTPALLTRAATYLEVHGYQ